MKYVAALALSAGLVSVASASEMIDFSGLVHGEIVAEQYAGMGVHISAINPNRPFDLAGIFDTTLGSTSDPDLEDPWSMGNTDLSTMLGNVLIIQENDQGDPDDEGNRPAGELHFNFDFVAQSFGFTVIDVESNSLEHSMVSFYLDGSLVSSVDFGDFEAGGTHDNGAIFGDNSINLISEFDVLGGYDQVVFNVGGSMAFDNIAYAVPAPSSLALLGLGGAMGFRRRR